MNFGQDNQLIGGSYYQNNFSQEQNQEFTQQFEAITLKMVAALDSGETIDSEPMQQAVREHFEFCSRFWKPDRESYKSLALSFTLPTAYNETYEGYRAGLGNFVYQAMVHFADTQL